MADVMAARLNRRQALHGGISVTTATLLGASTLTACSSDSDSPAPTPAPTPAPAPAPAPAAAPKLGFAAVAKNRNDLVTVPEGYTVEVIAPWGDPVGLSGELPAFAWDASNSAADQALQMGMHHDGIHYFAQNGSGSGLLVMNHEYVDDGLLHADGVATWSAEKVRKSQAAHGVSVIEVEQQGSRWQVVRPSPWARRITATTPMAVGGPAAGHPLLRTAADPAGQQDCQLVLQLGFGGQIFFLDRQLQCKTQCRHAAWNDRNLVHRLTGRHVFGNQGMTGFVKGNAAFFLGPKDAVFLLGSGHDPIDSRFEIGHRHRFRTH